MDLVYICKPGDNEELRYSIRSAVKNLKFDNLYLVGGKPDWYDGKFIAVEAIPNKFKNTQKCLSIVCSTKSISNNFILMNDDFFILKKIDKIIPYYSETIKNRMESYSKKSGRNYYFSILSETNKLLVTNGIKDPLNYDIHTPMVFNKVKLKRVLDLSLAPRSIYGNLYAIGGENIKDVKAYEKRTNIKDFDIFISTQEKSFIGLIEYFEELFPDKSIYEK